MARRRTQVDRKAAKAEQRREVGVSPGEHPLLALQRSAGNSAVTESLLARDATKTAPKEEPPKSGGSVKVTIDGIGTIDAVSYTLPRDKEKDMTVMAEQSKLSARIMEYAAEGKRIERVVLELGYIRVVLKDVYITGVSIGGSGHGDGPAIETYKFSFGEIDMQFPDAISGA
jgi:hypothetical protein